jgi:hypothetical protein
MYQRLYNKTARDATSGFWTPGLQEAGTDTLVPFTNTADAQPADEPQAWDDALAWFTTAALVSPQLAALQHWEPGDTILVTSFSQDK